MTDDQDHKLARAADLLRRQTAKIKELEAEIDRLNGVIETSHDALAHLQKVYSDPNAQSIINNSGFQVLNGFWTPAIDTTKIKHC